MERIMMAGIKELFEKRDIAFKSISDEIFASLPNVLEGCKKFISDRGGDTQLLEWDDVNYLEDQNLILLLGSISYNPGDTVLLPNGEKAVVNENTADYFKAMLRLGIPYELAISGSEQDIFDFLKTTIEVEEIEDEPHPEETHDGVEMMSTDDFDLNGLTEDQRKAMDLFIAAESLKGSKN